MTYKFSYVPWELKSRISLPIRREPRISRALTRAHVHVRHINYNDFLPLMLEQDLNYRYSLRVHGGERRSEEERKRRKEKKRERERERMGKKARPSVVITGCERTFQESDSRQNSRVMGQSCPCHLFFLHFHVLWFSLYIYIYIYIYCCKCFLINQSSLKIRETRKLSLQFILDWNRFYKYPFRIAREIKNLYREGVIGTHRATYPCAMTNCSNCKWPEVVNQRVLDREHPGFEIWAQLNRKTCVAH